MNIRSPPESVSCKPLYLSSEVIRVDHSLLRVYHHASKTQKWPIIFTMQDRRYKVFQLLPQTTQSRKV